MLDDAQAVRPCRSVGATLPQYGTRHPQAGRFGKRSGIIQQCGCGRGSGIQHDHARPPGTGDKLRRALDRIEVDQRRTTGDDYQIGTLRRCCGFRARCRRCVDDRKRKAVGLCGVDCLIEAARANRFDVG